MKRSFTRFDPLLLLPEARRGILLDGAERIEGFNGLFSPLSQGDGPAEVVVALDPQEGFEPLVARAWELLLPGGTFMACLPNARLPAPISRRLYQSAPEPQVPGVTAGRIRRGLAQAGFVEPQLYAWVPSDRIPYALFPLDDVRMLSFYLNQLIQRGGWKRNLARSLAPMLTAHTLAPRLVCVARKDPWA